MLHEYKGKWPKMGERVYIAEGAQIVGDVEIGDIIVAINGQRVGNSDDLYHVLDNHEVGETVNVEIIRNSRRMTVPVRLAEAPSSRGVIRR